MRKIIIKLLCVLTVITVFCTIPVLAGGYDDTTDEPKIKAQGKCGDKIDWILTDNYDLIISGKGKMTSAPWETYSNLIKTATIEDGVTSICDSAFLDCKKLENVDIPRSVHNIGKSAFENCVSLKNVTLPNGMYEVGYRTFKDCTNLESINIPNTAYLINNYAFLNCVSLKNIEFPGGMIDIGKWAFEGCSSITSIHLPPKARWVDGETFKYCSSLEKITVDPKNPYFFNDNNGVLFKKFNGKESRLACYPAANTSTTYNIPENVIQIDSFAFSLCNNLTSVTVPSTARAINASAFDSCENLNEIIIYSKDTAFAYNAFNNLPRTFTIKGYKDSTAEEYADTYGLKFAEIKNWKNPFTDIKVTDSYYDAVMLVTSEKLFNGTSENTFDPHVNMTRAMFVTVLGRLDGADTSKYTTPTFSDVKYNAWYTPYVEWAAANGIVEGYGNGIFGIDNEITVMQACTILARYSGFKKIKKQTESIENFPDVAKVSEWAYDSVKWAVENNIYAGIDGELRPHSSASRALIATMLANYISEYK